MVRHNRPDYDLDIDDAPKVILRGSSSSMKSQPSNEYSHMVMLRGFNSPSSREILNTVTISQPKVMLRGLNSSKKENPKQITSSSKQASTS